MDEVLYEQITALTDEGNKRAQEGDWVLAKEKFWQAFDLLPEPKMEWQATTWILAAIGDMWFLLEDFEKARYAFFHAIRCPGGLGSPFIHLRLGEIAFEVGDMGTAADELTRAYMGGGREAFQAEDAKYFSFLESILPPPKGKHSL